MSREPADADTLGRLKRELLAYETNTLVRLAPDGRQVLFVKNTDDRQELWLLAGGCERRAAAHPGEMIADPRWSADGTWCLYRHARRGREQWALSAVRVADLTSVTMPAPGPVAEYWLSRARPSTVAYACRDPASGAIQLIHCDLDGQADQRMVASDRRFRRWIVDGELRPRGGTAIARDGSVHIMLGADAGSARTVLKVPVEDVPVLAILRFDHSGQRLFLLTSAGARTRRLIAVGAEDAAVEEIFADPALDLESYPIAGEGVWFDPVSGEPDLCAVIAQRLRYHPLTARTASATARLAVGGESSHVVIDRSAKDDMWLTVAVHDDAPIVYQLFDPRSAQVRPLFVNRPGLIGFTLAKLEDFCFTASDGTPVSGYAMRPPRCTPPLPTVVLVHGGPGGRDLWRFFADAQYLAALGFLSLHINYRGSRGFGSDFLQAGNGEWGGRMQQDLYDGVAAAVAAGLADARRIVFFGTSYGGYAALLAACTRPDLARAAIAISAPTDLVSFAGEPPPYWQPLAVALRRQILRRAGGQMADEDTLRSRSPAHVLTPSCAPVLMVHGARDPRVPVASADEFAAAAREQGVAISYLRFADEGHHVKSDANRQVLFTAIEDFLEEHIGRAATTAEAAVCP